MTATGNMVTAQYNIRMALAPQGSCTCSGRLLLTRPRTAATMFGSTMQNARMSMMDSIRWVSAAFQNCSSSSWGRSFSKIPRRAVRGSIWVRLSASAFSCWGNCCCCCYNAGGHNEHDATYNPVERFSRRYDASFVGVSTVLRSFKPSL